MEEAPNGYLAVLEREEDVQCAKEYYDIEEKNVNSAMSELSCYSYIKDSNSNCVSVMSLLLNMSTVAVTMYVASM